MALAACCLLFNFSSMIQSIIGPLVINSRIVFVSYFVDLDSGCGL